MRFHGLAEALLGSPARVAVLKSLMRHPDKEWTGREVSRAAGVSPTQAIAALRSLEAEGVCWRRVAGRASLWTVDTDHVLVPDLRRLASLDETVQRALRSKLELALRKSGAEEAYLFGSVAAGNERWDSDVDIFVVFSDKTAASRWSGRLERLRSEIQRTFSTFLQPLVFHRAQLRTPQRRRLLDEARQKGIRLEVGR